MAKFLIYLLNTFGLLLLINYKSSACSCSDVWSFLESFDKYSNKKDLVKVVKLDDYYWGMHVKVIEKEEECEVKDTITIWGINAMSCRWSRTNEYNNGDTLFYLLSATDLEGNSISQGSGSPSDIEKEGDYMLGNCACNILTIKNGVVFGLISDNILELPIDSFYNLIYHSSSQNPLVSIDTTSQWNMSRYVLALENDTMIQDKSFKKLIEYKDFEKSKILDIYFLREDTIGKVYLADGRKEVLAFDFGLVAGDSLILNLLYFQSDKYNLLFKIDSIGTVVLNSKEYPAQFISAYSYYNNNLSDRYISDIFVKGIGSLGYGIVYPPLFGVGGSTPFLLCYLANNEVVYQSPDCSDCFTFVSATLNEVSPQLIKLFPSKNGLLKLQPINCNKGEFSLYLLDGKQIIKQKVSDTETVFNGLNEGLYIYRYVTENGEIQTGKIVVR